MYFFRTQVLQWKQGQAVGGGAVEPEPPCQNPSKSITTVGSVQTHNSCRQGPAMQAYRLDTSGRWVTIFPGWTIILGIKYWCAKLSMEKQQRFINARLCKVLSQYGQTADSEPMHCHWGHPVGGHVRQGLPLESFEKHQGTLCVCFSKDSSGSPASSSSPPTALPRMEVGLGVSALSQVQDDHMS